KQFGAPDRYPAAQRYANWARCKRNWNAFGRVAAEINLGKFAPVADQRGTAPKLDRAPVIACEHAIAAANAQPGRNRIQRALVNIGEGCEAVSRLGDPARRRLVGDLL